MQRCKRESCAAWRGNDTKGTLWRSEGKGPKRARAAAVLANAEKQKRLLNIELLIQFRVFPFKPGACVRIVLLVHVTDRAMHR